MDSSGPRQGRPPHELCGRQLAVPQCARASLVTAPPTHRETCLLGVASGAARGYAPRMIDLGAALEEIAAQRATPAAAEWLRAQRQALTPETFAAAHAACGRKLGHEPVHLQPGEVQQLELEAPGAEGWPLSAVGRAALQLRLCEMLPEAEHLPSMRRLYQTGDNREREALLHNLQQLPEPQRFAEIGVEACRSHVQSVFEAIACENPYPARHFSEPAFHQVVIKAFFTEVSVARIVGLPRRRSERLSDMARAYASERRAAGRSEPQDLSYVTGP